MKLFTNRFFSKSPARIALSIATILLLAGGLLVHYSKSEIFSEDGDEPNPDRPDLALLQDIERTKDLTLGYVPRERLLNVLDVINQQRAFRSSNNTIQSTNWSERGPNNVGGRTRALMFDPNDGTNGYKKVWAGGTGGGLWYTNDITAASPTWNSVDDFWANLAISTIAYDPSNTNNFYVGTGEGWFNSDAIQGAGIWKSSDGGSTWSQLSATNNSNFYYVQKIVVASNGDVFASTRTNGLYRSTDGGASWTKVLGSGVGASTNRAADIEIGADGTIYATMGIFSTDGIYSSTTGASGTWTKLNTGSNGFPTSGFYRIEIACAPSDANTLYAMACSSASGNPLLNIYKSTDKGSNWTVLGLPTWCDQGNSSNDMTRGQSWYDLVLTVSPSSASTVYAGGVDIMKSTDGGSTFSQITRWSSFGGCSGVTIHADQHAFTFQPGSSSVAVAGNDGGIYYTSNGGTSFSSKNNTYDVTQFYSCAMKSAASTNYYLAGAQDNGSQKFTSAGINSTTSPTGGDGAFCFIDQDNPNYQITSYVYNNFYLSTNGGTSFGTLTSDNNGSFINPADYDDVNNILYAGYNTGNLFRVTNITGSPSSGTISVSGMSGSTTHIRVSPNTASTVFVGTDAGKVYKITNANATPSTTNISGTLPSGSISCIEVGATDNDLIVTYSNYGLTSVWRTTNGGGTWSSREGNLPDMPVRWALTDPGNSSHVILATEVGVWETTDITVASPTWTAFSDFPNVRVDMLQTRSSDKEVIAATHGRGLYSSSTVFASGTPPVADFSGTPTTLCSGGTVSFSDLSSNTPTTWAWTFTGGTPSSSSSQNPTVTYNTPGTYAVSLTVTNSSGSDTKTVNSYITVNSCPAPVADFSGTPTTLCSGGTVSFSDLSSNTPTTWAWTFTGGTPSSSTSQNPTITYNTPGTYAVSLTATNSNGSDTKTVNGYITVNAHPSSSASVTNVSCNGGSNGAIDLTPSGGQSPYTFLWNPSGQTTEDRSSLTAATYTVTVTDNNGCTVQNSYAVSQPSALSQTLAKTDATCANNDGTATSTPSGGTAPYSYLWSPGGQTTQTATGLSSGTYTCAVTDNNGCSTSGSVAVNAASCVPNTQLSPSSCGISETSLSQVLTCVSVPGATNYQYRVNGPNVANFIYTNSTNQVYFYMSLVTGVQYNSTYAVEVRAKVGGVWGTFGNSCNVTTPSSLPTTELNTASCGISETSLSQTLYCNAVSGATNYQYRVNGPNVSNFIYTTSNAVTNFSMTLVTGVQYGGVYSVEVRAKVGGNWGSFGSVCNITTPASIPTTQLAAGSCGITLSSISQTLYCVAVPGATNYQYRVNGPNVANFIYTTTAAVTNFSLSLVTGVQSQGTYAVEVRAKAGNVWGVFGPICNVTTPSQQAPEYRMGEQENLQSNTLELNIYPNPFTDNITLSANSEIRLVTVLNTLGQAVYTGGSYNENPVIDLDELDAGIYFIRVETAAGIISAKVIKR